MRISKLYFLPNSPNSDHQRCTGVVLQDGTRLSSSSVVLTTGTFLRGVINVGLDHYPAGRIGESPSIGLALTLEKAGFRMGRLKTGTPPRIKVDSIDFDVLEILRGDEEPIPFSFMNKDVWLRRSNHDTSQRSNENESVSHCPPSQMLAHIVHTNASTERLVRDNIHLSRHVREEIVGPRYCPSIESKVQRFPGRQHQVILEPEGFDSRVVYPQNLAVTLPEELQVQMIRTMKGLEKAEISMCGYGVEYDFVDPRELKPSLETKRIQVGALNL